MKENIKHERVKNQRKDFIHKISNKLVSKNQAIFLETLDVKNMIKNRHLSKSIADVGWGEFIRQLKYKSKLFGTIIIQIGKWEPTSKLCSTPSCSYKNKSLSLADRYWECPICKTIHDRDINAAKNIEIIGREAPELKPVEKKANVFSIKKIQAFPVKQESLAS
jgi:putative transposase